MLMLVFKSFNAFLSSHLEGERGVRDWGFEQLSFPGLESGQGVVKPFLPARSQLERKAQRSHAPASVSALSERKTTT